ncbi:MAG: hypothetical protein PHD11_07255, partial [Bacteroidales bacterium]|nr:hypothetical protein [Bacteroidales bacterium]
MNIVVVPLNSTSYYTRPDTTLEKESKDYYCPDDVSLLSLSVSVNIKIIKAGKAVAKRFADRYYNEFGIGVMMYGESIIKDGNPLSFCMASSL